MDQLLALIHKFTIFDALDIAIVSYVFYRVILLIRGTRAVQLLKGIIVLLIATGLSHVLHLQALNWLLTQVLMIGLLAIPVVFQPELRRALEQLGRSRFTFTFRFQEVTDLGPIIHEMVTASQVFSKNRIGALIVFERDTGLNEYVETGIPIGATITAALMINSFIPNTPLHDGAMIIRGDRIIAASCYLPLSDSTSLGKELGTRHRAAVGVSEQSDALAIVVSEETGKISIAEGGVLWLDLDERTLTQRLTNGLSQDKKNAFRWFSRRGKAQ